MTGVKCRTEHHEKIHRTFRASLGDATGIHRGPRRAWCADFNAAECRTEDSWMSLYVRVVNGFYTHRKTIRLRLAIGDAAFWVPPRIWAYASENQPDGCFGKYSAEEIAMLIGYSGNASDMLQALLQAGFLDADPLRVHDWEEHNGYHVSYAERAKKAAAARWGKSPPAPPLRPDLIVPDPSIASGIASSMNGADLTHYHKDTRTVLHLLNEASGKGFREVDSNLRIISQRLRENGVDLEGIRLMILRQCKRWLNTSQAEYLRPETLFAKTKFDGYYAARLEPVLGPAPQVNPRNPTGSPL